MYNGKMGTIFFLSKRKVTRSQLRALPSIEPYTTMAPDKILMPTPTPTAN